MDGELIVMHHGDLRECRLDVCLVFAGTRA